MMRWSTNKRCDDSLEPTGETDDGVLPFGGQTRRAHTTPVALIETRHRFKEIKGMVNPQFIALAAGKTSNPEEQEHLKRIEALARELATLEYEFPAKIAANKNRRGEKPTKLTKNEKTALAEFDEDRANIDRETLKLFESTASAREIVEALSLELPGVPKDWSWMVPKAHPQDRALIEQVVAAQRALDAEMKKYLEAYSPA